MLKDSGKSMHKIQWEVLLMRKNKEIEVSDSDFYLFN